MPGRPSQASRSKGAGTVHESKPTRLASQQLLTFSGAAPAVSTSEDVSYRSATRRTRAAETAESGLSPLRAAGGRSSIPAAPEVS